MSDLRIHYMGYRLTPVPFFSTSSSKIAKTSEFAIINMKELDELDNMVALRGLMKDLDCARARADREGWIDADEAERILGVND